MIRDGEVTLKLSSNSCSRAAFYPSAGSKTAIAGYDLSTALHLAKPKYGDGIEWKLKQDVDFLRDA